MSTFIRAVLLAIIGCTAKASEPANVSYTSPDAFVQTITAAKPATELTPFNERFAVKEPGQSEDPKTGAIARPQKLEVAGVLWKDDSRAFVFIHALPPTNATRSVVGMLVLLTKSESGWKISDILTSTALGKYSEIAARVAPLREFPVVTIAEVHGGKGKSSEFTRTFTHQAGRIVELDPKP